MAYAILRIFYGAWALGVLVFTLNALSALLFSRRLRGGRLKAVLVTPIFCAIWPLSLFSEAGRKALLGRFNQL